MMSRAQDTDLHIVWRGLDGSAGVLIVDVRRWGFLTLAEFNMDPERQRYIDDYIERSIKRKR